MEYTDMKLDYLVLGQNIKAQRKKLGMKQRELAEQVHVTAQHISHIETGQTQVSLPVLISISNVLKVDLNTLVNQPFMDLKNSLYRREIEALLSEMGEKKAKVCLDLCRLFADSDL